MKLSSPQGNHAMPNKEDRYVIPSVVRALQILEAFSSEKTTYTNAEISRKLGLNKSSVTRLLYSLEKARFIKRNIETGSYQLTHKSLQIGRVYISQVNYHKVAMPVLQELTTSCQETSHLGVLEEMEVLYLDWVASNQTVSLASFTGKKLPAYCTGVGKNFLAYMDEETLSSYLQNTRLEQHTAKTITDPEKLKKHLKRVKQQGYAIDDGEFQEVVISVSSPIFDVNGRILAGISVAGPAFRMRNTFLNKQVIPKVREAGTEISKRLGWDGMCSNHSY